MTTDEQAGVRYCIPQCCIICAHARIDTQGPIDSMQVECFTDDPFVNYHAIDENCEHFALRDFGQEIEMVVGQ